MKYSFHPLARTELISVIEYYNECQENLGLDFAKEINLTINRIIDYPEAWPKLSEKTRRCLCSRFPFGIVYQVFHNEVFIIAVMQLNRKPGYWEDRI
jgi:hypothetical protein